MRRLAGLALLVVALACADDRAAPTAPGSASPSTPVAAASHDVVASAGADYVQGRVLVLFRPGAPVASLLAPHRASVRREVLLGIQMLDVPAGAERAVAAALARNPWVEFAEPDYLRTHGIPCGTGDCRAPTDPYFGFKWDHHNDGSINDQSGARVATTGKVDADIDWLEAFDQLGAFTGAAKIGILDTGIRATHQDLTGKLAVQRDFFAGDGTAEDDDGHGTHVAGIAAAHGGNGLGVTGVAWGKYVNLVVAKVCGPIAPGGYGCPSSAIAEGMRWAVDNGAHVVNVSLGGTSGSATERAAFQYARSRNVLPFCAAGNEARTVSFPAAFPECVAVSATDWSDELASYSNFGPEVDIAAPGGDTENANGYSYILSTFRTSNSSYLFMAGTSMATPQAAGLGALLHVRGIRDDDAKLTRIQSTADDLGVPGPDPMFGAGRINVFRAINGASAAPPPAPGIVLTATRRIEGTKKLVDLKWTGATGERVDLWRNGKLYLRPNNDGEMTDNVGSTASGTYTYKICETNSTKCSNEASVVF